MRMEVHVHGSIFLGRGVRLSQVEHALRPWLEYLDVETVGEAPSLEREEPGIVFDSRKRTVNICWTGEVGRSFCPLRSASEVSFFRENGTCSG